MPELRGNSHFHMFTAIFTGDARSPTGEYRENRKSSLLSWLPNGREALTGDAETSTTLA